MDILHPFFDRPFYSRRSSRDLRALARISPLHTRPTMHPGNTLASAEKRLQYFYWLQQCQCMGLARHQSHGQRQATCCCHMSLTKPVEVKQGRRGGRQAFLLHIGGHMGPSLVSTSNQGTEGRHPDPFRSGHAHAHVQSSCSHTCNCMQERASALARVCVQERTFARSCTH